MYLLISSKKNLIFWIYKTVYSILNCRINILKLMESNVSYKVIVNTIKQTKIMFLLNKEPKKKNIYYRFMCN